MKKILLCLTIASVALALFLVPCSALTSSPSDYSSSGAFGEISYTVNQGSNAGKVLTYPIGVSSLQTSSYSSSSQIYQYYRADSDYISDHPDSFWLARVAHTSFPGLELNRQSPLTLRFAVQYTPAQLRAMGGYDANIKDDPAEFLEYANRSLIEWYGDAQLVKWEVTIIREYRTGSKTDMKFYPNDGTYRMRLQDTNQNIQEWDEIFTDTIKSVSFVIDAHLTLSPDGNDVLGIYLPPNYTYSTLNDDLQEYYLNNRLENSYNEGYRDATDHWEEANFDVFGWFGDTIQGFLDIQILPGFTIGTVLLAVFGVLALRAILALVGGG